MPIFFFFAKCSESLQHTMSVLQQHDAPSACAPRNFGSEITRDLFECPEYVLWDLGFAALSACAPCKFGPGLNQDLLEGPK